MHRRQMVLGLASLAGCAEFSMNPVEPRRPDAGDIDDDAIALLPAGVIGFASLDLAALYATPLGADFAAFVQSILPLGPEASFSPARDTSRLYGAFYAMQGIDFCAVVRGRFDRAAIARSADARSAPGGAMVKVRYGERDLYTVANMGFSLLTDKTMICGNEIAMRRMIDRLRYKRLRRAVPEWMAALGETPNAGFAVAADLGAGSILGKYRTSTFAKGTRSIATPILDAAAYRFPFLTDLRMIRIVGNFRAPGLNFAGALTYASKERAASGAESLKNASQLAQWASSFSSLGLGGSLPPIQVAVRGSDVGFVQPIDADVAKSLVSLMRSL